jgi:hypothetical protein
MFKNKKLKSSSDKKLAKKYTESKNQALRHLSSFKPKKRNNSILASLAVLTLILSVSLVYFSLNTVNGSVLGEFSSKEIQLKKSSLNMALGQGGIRSCQPLILTFQDPEVDLKTESTLVVNLENLEQKSLTTIFSQTKKPLSQGIEVLIPCQQVEAEYRLQVEIVQYQASQQDFISWQSQKFQILTP